VFDELQADDPFLASKADELTTRLREYDPRLDEAWLTRLRSGRSGPR